MTAALRLTPRQREVVRLLADGDTCPTIARKLRIAVSTVRQHIRDIAARLEGTQPPIRRIVANAHQLLAA